MAAALPLASATPARELPGARLVGEGELRWLGLAVYAARLWTVGAFEPAQPRRHAFVLELHYRMPFRASDIARRSIEEMRRGGPIDEGVAARWREALMQAIPDVRAGDTLAGVHEPGSGVRFLHNGRPCGEVADAAFATRFFDIWLGPATSEPALRDALLGRAAR